MKIGEVQLAHSMKLRWAFLISTTHIHTDIVWIEIKFKAHRKAETNLILIVILF